MLVSRTDGRTDGSASTDCGSQFVTSLQVTIQHVEKGPQEFAVDESRGGGQNTNLGIKKCPRQFDANVALLYDQTEEMYDDTMAQAGAGIELIRCALRRVMPVSSYCVLPPTH